MVFNIKGSISESAEFRAFDMKLRVTSYSVHAEYYSVDRAMAQAVIRRPANAEARVRSRVGPCGIYGVQNDTGTGFSPSASFFFCVSFIHQCYNKIEKQKKTRLLNFLYRRFAQ
jgi:hypothetical protein